MPKTANARFNALCDVVIYHFCDCMRKSGKSAKLLVKQGVMEDADDGEAAYTAYDEAVTEYMLDHLPDGFHRTYDYWGAPCITNASYTPKSDTDNPDGRVFAAGDTGGRIMFFDNFAALEEYTQDCIERIAEVEEQFI